MRVLMRFLMCSLTVAALALYVAPLASAQCDCPFQGDANMDGIVDAIDDLVGPVFFYTSISQDPMCLTWREDWNADGVVDAIDMQMCWDNLFFGGPVPVDPCSCGFPCTRHIGIGTADVIVESKTVLAGSVDSVGIYVTNSTAVSAIVIPLVAREISTYPTRIEMNVPTGGRIGSTFTEVLVQLGFDLMDGECGGGPGTGFSQQNTDFKSGQFLPGSTPDGLLLGTSKLFASTLSPGQDIVPSAHVVFTAPMTLGTFEVDTSCTDWANHLAFIEESPFGEVKPSFTKGVVTVVDCLCSSQCDFNGDGVLDAVDLNGMIEALFFGGPDPQDPGCPITRADFNNDSFADATDLNALIDHLFFGGSGPVDPCAGI